VKKDKLTELFINHVMPWVLIIIISVLVEVFDLMDLLSTSKNSLLLLAVGVILLIIVLFVIARKYLSEPDIELDFASDIKPKNQICVDRGEKFQLVWYFKNNSNKTIRILSYNIRINFNNKPLLNHPWIDKYQEKIIAHGEKTKEWSLVSADYYNLNEPGEYEFQSIVEYEIVPNGGKGFVYDTNPLIVYDKRV